MVHTDEEPPKIGRIIFAKRGWTQNSRKAESKTVQLNKAVRKKPETCSVILMRFNAGNVRRWNLFNAYFDSDDFVDHDDRIKKFLLGKFFKMQETVSDILHNPCYRLT